MRDRVRPRWKRIAGRAQGALLQQGDGGCRLRGVQVWMANQFHYTVVGIVADVPRPNRNGEGDAGFHWAMFLPLSPAPMLSNYIVRSAPADRARIVQAGVVIGMILAYGINLYLMQHYQLNRMPWFYLPVSAIALWILGQLAVLGPALRASSVPPVVATRGA